MPLLFEPPRKNVGAARARKDLLLLGDGQFLKNPKLKKLLKASVAAGDGVADVDAIGPIGGPTIDEQVIRTTS